ncbi:MAG: phosphoribosylamine--glycine ligase [bacterium]|nr:phosphoribosylamine--glycine ligase [bacterium]
MRVLIVGKGGREHALTWMITQSPRKPEILAAPGNPGIAKFGTCYPISDTNLDGIVNLAVEKKVDIVVVGPENPLDAGLVDRLADANILAFGPTAAAARLESSKLFGKGIMEAAGVTTPDYRAFNNPGKALKYLRELHLSDFPIVIKADGLAFGKGVYICLTLEAAERAVQNLMVARLLGEAGDAILVEDFVSGLECSVLAVCDGERFVYFRAIRDYKRIGVGDTGENTGGMGAVTPVPGCDIAFHEWVADHIIAPILAEMRRRGIPYKGCLYLGLLIKDGVIYVLEFNVRFGDPETQPAMLMLDEDLLKLMLDASHGNLAISRPARWLNGAAACIVGAANGYPGNYAKGKAIYGINEVETDDTIAFQAGTARHGNILVTDGGRVVGVTSYDANSLPAALDKSLAGISKIRCSDMIWRPDIGHNAV